MSVKTVIITGGSSGIGLSISEHLIKEQYNVIILDLISPNKSDAIFLKCDITNENEVVTTFQTILKQHSTIYGVINNAGIICDKMIWKMTSEEFDKVINVNLKGTWLICREAAKIMKHQNYGRIINISSRAWLGNPGQTNYSASKAGIIGLSRALALELGKYNVSVNVIAPGLIDTPLTQSLSPEVRQKLINLQPQKNIGKPEDVAQAVAFLLNEKTNFINGQLLYVDGGCSIGLSI